MHTITARTAGSLLVALAALLCLALTANAARTGAARTTATTVKVTAGKPSEFKYTVAPSSVKPGAVTFKITNKGALAHTFKVCSSAKGGSANSCTGKGTPMIAPGKTGSLTITFTKAGSYEYLCTIPGHAAAGMKGDLKVT